MPARPTGLQLVELARQHLGEPYLLGALVPKSRADWSGPWDCAEFASWVVYQEAGILYGVESDQVEPNRADAYSGYWLRDARTRGTRITIEEAAKIPGAFLVRSPAERRGHVAISDGAGGTIEAHSRATGVCARTIAGRVWTCGVLVPGIDYAPTGAGGG